MMNVFQNCQRVKQALLKSISNFYAENRGIRNSDRALRCTEAFE